MKLLTLLPVILITAFAPPRVAIQVQGATIICTVPRHQDNRSLDIGIEGRASHLVQLDGAGAPVTHRFDIPPYLRCDGEEVFTGFCLLTRVSGSRERVKQTFICRQ